MRDRLKWALLLCGFAVGGCNATPRTRPVGGAAVDAAMTLDLSADFATPVSPDDLSGPMDGPRPPNLVPNGDFELGNTMFASDYTYDAASLWNAGSYSVAHSAQALHPALLAVGDHTTGSGFMFIGNGKATADRVWFSSTPIAVAPNTDYYFEAWVMNECCVNQTTPTGPSGLTFYANEVPIGTRVSSKLGEWEGLSTTWSSGSATTVTLKLVNANTIDVGNDFAVDDIYLGTQSTVIP